jgi:hypothetical protein
LLLGTNVEDPGVKVDAPRLKAGMLPRLKAANYWVGGDTTIGGKPPGDVANPGDGAND